MGRDSLIEADWNHLQKTLEAVTDAVMVADPGGTLQEIFAVFQGWTEASEMFSGNPFVQELLSVSPDELGEINDRESGDIDRTNEETIQIAVEKCRQAIAILKAKDPEDVETYRRVTMFLGEKVARAAVEGGFLGIGGKRVSDPEQAVLDMLNAALE